MEHISDTERVYLEKWYKVLKEMPYDELVFLQWYTRKVFDTRRYNEEDAPKVNDKLKYLLAYAQLNPEAAEQMAVEYAFAREHSYTDEVTLAHLADKVKRSYDEDDSWEFNFDDFIEWVDDYEDFYDSEPYEYDRTITIQNIPKNIQKHLGLDSGTLCIKLDKPW